MHSFVGALALLRAPIVIVLLAAVVMIVPQQSNEIFQAFVEARGSDLAQEMARVLAFGGLLALTLLGCAVQITRHATPRYNQVVEHAQNWVEATALALPIWFLLAVLVAMAQLSYLPYVITWSVTGIAAVMAMAILVLLAYWGGARGRLISSARRLFSPFSHLGIWWGLAATALLVVTINAAIVHFPLLSPWLGPIAVVCLFLSVLCLAATQLGYLWDRHQIPATAALLVAAMAWGWSGSNNNHHIRAVYTKDAKTMDASEAFAAWLDGRPDIDANSGKPYPVYIAAAEGGGIYAAAHAALALADIQDRCPAFASHLFAVSGVSGGSLGAALFAALVKANGPNPRQPSAQSCVNGRPEKRAMREAVLRYFDSDFLSPLLAYGLFPDFAQRFWPRPVPAFDRARALEDSFSGAWKRIAGQGRPENANLFGRTFRDLWSPDQDQPALLLNSTLVQRGDRVIISPFKLFDLEHRIFGDSYVDLLNGDYGTSLAAAVGASARFPIVSPPALLLHKGYRLSAQLVDGGFFEASGINTVINLIELLRRGQPIVDRNAAPGSEATGCAGRNSVRIVTPQKRTVNVCIKIITIRARIIPFSDAAAGDLTAPLSAVLRAGLGRERSMISLLNNLFCGGRRCGLGAAAAAPHIYNHFIDIDELSLPLGWFLSARSRMAIANMDDKLPACVALSAGPSSEIEGTPKERSVMENACLFARIAADLSRS